MTPFCGALGRAGRLRWGRPGNQFRMISLAVLAFVLSMVLSLAARRLLRWRSARYPQDAPQRFHVGDVPRVGGIGLLAGAALALAGLPLLQAA